MKILLLEHPRNVCPERCNDIANTPLSSCLLSGYVAGQLKSEGHEVEILEGFLNGLTYEEIERKVNEMRPDVLGVHLVYHWQRDLALLDFLHRVKIGGLSPYITIYGFYPTIAYKDVLEQGPDIDSVILGEPELTFAEIAAAISSHYELGSIPGLAQRDDAGAIVHLPSQPLMDLDRLPFPVRTEAMFRLPEVNLLGSRGCYGRCTFCYIGSFYGQGHHWRGRTPENIVAEIDDLIARRNVKEFYFTDPNFFGPGERGQRRALQLASLLKSRHIRFGIEARVNDIHDETIKALVEAGLHNILIGLESGSDSALQRMQKMTSVAENERAIGILRRHGIEPNIGFIMFEPNSSIEDTRINLKFLKRNDLLRNLPTTANLLYHHQIILEGTSAYQDLQREGRLELQASIYEGVAPIADPKVARLASIMRQITNFLFGKMDGIWGGKVTEPGGARERYTKINALLVGIFENTLSTLETGGQFTDKEAELLVKTVQEEIAGILA